MKVRLITTILVLFLAGLFAHADSLELRDGRHFQGKYIGGTPDVLAFSSEGTTQYFAIEDVLALVFGGAQRNSPWDKTPRHAEPGIQLERQKDRAKAPPPKTHAASERQNTKKKADPKFSLCESGTQRCL